MLENRSVLLARLGESAAPIDQQIRPEGDVVMNKGVPMEEGQKTGHELGRDSANSQHVYSCYTDAQPEFRTHEVV